MAPCSGTNVFINLIHFPVYTLGIGKRTGIWFQGCSIGCKGCISQHTWKKNDYHKTKVSDVVESIKKYDIYQPDGITISGGEPFDQPQALYYLLLNLKCFGYQDIMVYSGYRFRYLKKKYSQIIDLIDILVDGKFEEGQETDYIWKGSDNQNMIILTKNEELKNKYLVYQQTSQKKRTLQMISVKEEYIHIIGIPNQKDSKAIKYGFF